MGAIESVAVETNSVTYYVIPGNIEHTGCWEWIYATCKSGIVDVKYVAIDDLEYRNSEDSDDAQLKAPIDKERFFSMKCNRVRMISIVGIFKNRPVVIGINLDERRIVHL